MKKSLFEDILSRNIGYLSVLVLVLSLQVLIIFVFVYQFIPLKLSPITHGVPPALLKLFQPNRNHFFYHVFIASAIIGQVAALYFYRKRIAVSDLTEEIRPFLLCETLWVSWQLLAVFKILQYDNPSWARGLLYAGLAAALLGKVFWPELSRWLKSFQTSLAKDIPQLWRCAIDTAVILFLALAIMVPDTEKALVRIAMADNFATFNHWLMSPVNQLNWGAVALVHTLTHFMGGLTYGHTVAVLCCLAILYYTTFYYLLRYWLGVLPAVFGLFLAVKLQMFNIGVNPLIWAFPGESILRHTLDVLVFCCLLLFARGQGELFLWLAAVVTGLSLAYVFDTGFYLVVALYAYVAAILFFKETRLALLPSPRQWRKILGLSLVPWLGMFMALWCCVGPDILHKEFWVNSFKDLPQWLHGIVSIYSCLRERNFFAFFASFIVPLFYAAGITAVISMVAFRRWKSETLFLVPLSVYGLGVYAHFLCFSVINLYYMVPLPLVGSICFWTVQGTSGLNQDKQRFIKGALAMLTLIGLLTNFLFTYYPNVFNLAQENWDSEKAYYHAHFKVE